MVCSHPHIGHKKATFLFTFTVGGRDGCVVGFFLLHSGLVFILWPVGTKASNYLTFFTWESPRFAAVVVAAARDTEWVKLDYKGFCKATFPPAGPAAWSHITPLRRLWGLEKNQTKGAGGFWITDVCVCGCVIWSEVVLSAWYRMLVLVPKFCWRTTLSYIYKIISFHNFFGIFLWQ